MAAVAVAQIAVRGSTAAPVARRVVADVAVATEVTPAPPATPVAAPAPRGSVRAAAVGPAVQRAPRAPAPARRAAWLEIASIGTRAPVVSVGLDRNGNMVTPRNAVDIAWLDNGSFPGPTRNAVLAGHRNWQGRPGSLIRLEHANPGDEVRVGVDGTVHTFRITWVRQVDPDNADVDAILGSTPVDSVTIITCGGEFNRKTGHYEDRIVARAEVV